MNKKVLRTLEYDKIIDLLEAKASSAQGKAACKKLQPMTDLAQIKMAQAETSDALSRIFKFGSVSFSDTYDVRESFKHLEVGSSLNAIELLHVAGLLLATKRIKNYGYAEHDERMGKDSLFHRFEELEPLTSVEKEIHRCILSEDQIADDASAELKEIRRKMSGMTERIRSQMNQMLNHATIRTYLQDGVITMRDGRYCLPVKAEYKTYVPGMVHDQSSSGSTFFIEPMAVVELNNHLRELQLQELEEIEKILADLSNLVAEHTDTIVRNFTILTELDFIFAKGELAKEYNGVAPIFNDKGIIRLRKARHPLLSKDTVVPIDITLGQDYDLLIVTGPNTGGKTVSLKTCGLLVLMGQAGLHIPTADRSEIAVFSDVYADIGDEQSIEQSLSTFSSHMTNIVRILQSVDAHPNRMYLCLFDELCAGTDPKEGAALATAILDHLHQSHVPTMATTHYAELKMYALQTDGVENASCEFSLETLSPTYHLLIGVPGKSNAFAISKKLGLPSDLIERAKENIEEEDQSFEDLFVDLEHKRVLMERDRRQIQSEKDQIASKRREIEEKQRRLDESKDKILRQANEDASLILRRAKDLADETIRDFNKFAKENPDIARMEQKRANLGKELSDKQAKASAVNTKKKENNHRVPKDLRIGDAVKVLSMNMNGTVTSLPDAKGNVNVQLGIMNSKVNIKDLMLLEIRDSATKPTSDDRKYYGSGVSKAASISSEINLLGLTTDEAISRLDKYLDDAYISHLKQVRVVHGKGTGALRKSVHQYLKKQKIVEDYHLGEYGEGDSGVTIVNLK